MRQTGLQRAVRSSESNEAWSLMGSAGSSGAASASRTVSHATLGRGRSARMLLGARPHSTNA